MTFTKLGKRLRFAMTSDERSRVQMASMVTKLLSATTDVHSDMTEFRHDVGVQSKMLRNEIEHLRGEIAVVRTDIELKSNELRGTIVASEGRMANKIDLARAEVWDARSGIGADVREARRQGGQLVTAMRVERKGNEESPS